jgi:hypothetical protein
MNDDVDERIRSGKALSESMGNFHVTGWDPDRKALKAAFTVRREYCHTNGTIAQGGFIIGQPDVYRPSGKYSVRSASRSALKPKCS